MERDGGRHLWDNLALHSAIARVTIRTTRRGVGRFRQRTDNLRHCRPFRVHYTTHKNQFISGTSRARDQRTRISTQSTSAASGRTADRRVNGSGFITTRSDFLGGWIR